MTTRQLTAVAIVVILAIVGIAAVLRPSLSDETIHFLHVAGLLLGALDVTIVAVSLLAAK